MRHISSRQEEEEVMSADVEGSISQSMAPVMRHNCRGIVNTVRNTFQLNFLFMRSDNRIKVIVRI